jgi:hypothetical protein
MMFSFMQAVGLYPPLYLSSPYLEQNAVKEKLIDFAMHFTLKCSSFREENISYQEN